jgi:phosphohistidine phosphatase
VQLYLLRHGIASPSSTSGRDLDRPLALQGISKIRDVVMRARGSGCKPSYIVSSPYLRAQQSAQIAMEELGFTEPLLTSNRLNPDSSAFDLWQEVREIENGSLLLVSHEPLLSTAAAWMTGDARVIIEFSPATLVRIDFESLGPAPSGQLKWQIDGV